MKDTQSTKSRFRGVYKCGKRWKAQLQSRGIQFYLGMFDSEEDAARAYDVKAREENGVKSLTNFDNFGNENILPSVVGLPQSSYSSENDNYDSDNDDNFLNTQNSNSLHGAMYNHDSISNGRNSSHSMKSGIDFFQKESDISIHHHTSKINDSMFQLNYNAGILWERFILISQRLLLAKATQIRLSELQILSPDTEKESILNSLNDEMVLLNIAKSQLEEAVSRVFMIGLDTSINHSQMAALSHYNDSCKDLNEDIPNKVVDNNYEEEVHQSTSFVTTYVDNERFGRHFNERLNNENLLTNVNNKNGMIVNNSISQVNNLQNNNLNNMLESSFNYLIPNSIMNETVDLNKSTSYPNNINDEVVEQVHNDNNNTLSSADYNWLPNNTPKDLSINSKRNFLYTDLLKPYSAVRNPAFIRAAAISNNQNQYPILNPSSDFSCLQYGYNQANYNNYGNYSSTVYPNQIEFRDYNNCNISNAPAVNTDKSINITSTISTDSEAKGNYGTRRSYANSYKRSKSSSAISKKPYERSNNEESITFNKKPEHTSDTFNITKNVNNEKQHERPQNIDMISAIDKVIALHNREADSKIHQKHSFKETLKES